MRIFVQINSNTFSRAMAKWNCQINKVNHDIWVKVFKKGRSKICGKQPLKKLTITIEEWKTCFADHITSNFLKAVFHKFTWSVLEYFVTFICHIYLFWMSNMEKNRSKDTVGILSHCWSVKVMGSKTSTELQIFFHSKFAIKKELRKTSLSFFVTVFKLSRCYRVNTIRQLIRPEKFLVVIWSTSEG